MESEQYRCRVWEVCISYHHIQMRLAQPKHFDMLAKTHRQLDYSNSPMKVKHSSVSQFRSFEYENQHKLFNINQLEAIDGFAESKSFSDQCKSKSLIVFVDVLPSQSILAKNWARDSIELCELILSRPNTNREEMMASVCVLFVCGAPCDSFVYLDVLQIAVIQTSCVSCHAMSDLFSTSEMKLCYAGISGYGLCVFCMHCALKFSQPTG